MAAAHGRAGNKALLRSRQGNTDLTDLVGRLPGDDTQLPRLGGAELFRRKRGLRRQGSSRQMMTVYTYEETLSLPYLPCDGC